MSVPADVYPNTHMRPGGRLVTTRAAVEDDRGHLVIQAQPHDWPTSECEPVEVATVYFRAEHVPSVARALATGLHRLCQDADLSVEQWDALLKSLDGVLQTATGRRAEAFHAEHDPLPLLPTDHVADEVTEEVS